MLAFLAEYWIAIAGIAALIFGYVLLILIPQLRENDTRNIYQNLGEPRMIWQVSELEKDFWTRYERERMRYIDSRNRFAIVQAPIIPFPYNTAWEFRWFDKTYHLSTVGLSYGDYLMAGVRFYHQMRKVWDEQVYTSFGTKEMMEKIKDQKPVDPDRLWQNTLN